jgi:phage gp36-like protein
MAFLNKTDLASAIYGYQVDQITEGDDEIVYQAIEAAIQEVKSFLSETLYDTVAIFSATGTNRNALILAHTKTIAKWYIVELCNADIIQEQAKDRYDRAISWLTKLSKGTVSLNELPVVSIKTTNSETDTFGFGSRTKFNHDL